MKIYNNLRLLNKLDIKVTDPNCGRTHARKKMCLVFPRSNLCAQIFDRKLINKLQLYLCSKSAGLRQQTKNRFRQKLKYLLKIKKKNRKAHLYT